MERLFQLKARKTTVRTELIAGMTTFFAMVYILMVNANMFADPFGDGSNPLGVSYGAVYIATAISAVVGTILAGLIANLPLAMASGMGLNAFFVYTVCTGFGLSYANALVLVFAEGLVFILLTVTGLRKRSLIRCLWRCVWRSLPASVCSLRCWVCKMQALWCPAPPPAWIWHLSTCSPGTGAASCPWW